ncbi:ABC transporter ATP-binding protein [Salipiger aestuarii]|nr:ABC transporter ATP-binding protein [Salipiger aestuarii]KAA8606746.1 ABC transporter ATP-binding protein [Salipiger aestuarii]KAA8610615.1 ABC transporter ATP-binding protein [Salipiger aestuarii]KAB2541363.1 ABC transporter ATP-binding protein [Salipiger aestuarii]
MLALTDLTKRFGKQTALDAVSLDISPGERVALLGHNGAGKSTMMKLILGLLTPDGGTVQIAGHPPGSAVARSLTAYLPENAAFHPSLTGREMLRHYLRLRGQDPRGADALLEKVGLGDAGGRRIGGYSKGMRQRVGLAQALIGTPRLMVLDEPTTGLDPISRRDFYALLDELAERGAAILLSSHALSELEARTDRIVVLAQSRMVAQGTLADLRRAATLPLTVHLAARAGQGAALAQAFPEAQAEGDRLILACPQEDKLTVLERIAARRDLIADFDLSSPTLDDLYAQISGRENGRAA